MEGGELATITQEKRFVHKKTVNIFYRSMLLVDEDAQCTLHIKRHICKYFFVSANIYQ